MTKIISILNLTPNSCSEDGIYNDAVTALNRIDHMIQAGVHVIDIGAESTRPNAESLSAEEEWRRLAPVLTVLDQRLEQVQFSLDTHHPENAAKALTLGFHWINDVTSGRNPDMIKVIKKSNCSYVIMHSLSIPADPKENINPMLDPVQVVLNWAQESIEKLEQAGIQRSRIIIDPGIGFGKIAEHSLQLIQNINQFKKLPVPLLIGHSRKRFLRLFSDKPYHQRDPETLALSYYLVEQGTDYLRVHDFENHMILLKIQASLVSVDEQKETSDTTIII
jgi:dihydropteroate synthase